MRSPSGNGKPTRPACGRSWATPAATRDALYRQAGVIAADTLTELVATTALLCWQPVPAGPGVVVVSNAGGAGVLAADACAMQDLDLVEPSERTRATLRDLLPPHASVHNPIDTTAGIDPATFGACLEAVLADDTVHAVLSLAAPTAVSDPAAAITEAVARARSKGITTPVLAMQLSQPEVIRALPAQTLQPVPSYADSARRGARADRRGPVRAVAYPASRTGSRSTRHQAG